MRQPGKALGAKRWQLLHKLVYGIAVLAVLHFLWIRSSKHRYGDVVLYGGIVALLLAAGFTVLIARPIRQIDAAIGARGNLARGGDGLELSRDRHECGVGHRRRDIGGGRRKSYRNCAQPSVAASSAVAAPSSV